MASGEGVCLRGNKSAMLNRPNLPGSFSSSFSDQEKLDGADEGPGEMGRLLGVEVRGILIGLLESRLGLRVMPAFSSGSGAVFGVLGGASMASADKVRRCFVGLRPVRGPKADPGGARFLDTSFWKSCRQYMSFMLGLIHLLLACAA
jgi:hypothetical protein